MTKNILFYEKPLILNVELAKLIGLNESIVLQQMQYWLERSHHTIEGVKWIYNTYADWKLQFPFFSESTIKRIIKRLEDKNIIRSSNFNKFKMDNTKWYTINYDFFCQFQPEQSTEQIEETTCSTWSDEQTNLDKAIPENTTETNLQEDDDKKGPDDSHTKTGTSPFGIEEGELSKYAGYKPKDPVLPSEPYVSLSSNSKKIYSKLQHNNALKNHDQ